MKILYQCETCRKMYDTRKEAAACEDTPYEVRWTVGDIVKCGGARFGWYNGDIGWVVNRKPYIQPPGSHRYEFIYVITAIDRAPKNEHLARYHLATKAMLEGTGYDGGYTIDDPHYHYRIERISLSPKHARHIIEGMRDLMGRTFESPV